VLQDLKDVGLLCQGLGHWLWCHTRLVSKPEDVGWSKGLSALQRLESLCLTGAPLGGLQAERKPRIRFLAHRFPSLQQVRNQRYSVLFSVIQVLFKCYSSVI